jgi:hypothetical protein
MSYRQDAPSRRPPVQWSYALDYDKEIASDEARIALYDGPVTRAITASLDDVERTFKKQTGYYDAFSWLWYKPELVTARAAILGLSDDELCALARYQDTGREPEHVQAYSARYTRQAGVQVAPLVKRLEEVEVLLEEERLKRLKKAKTDRARHIRNKAKYGDQ